RAPWRAKSGSGAAGPSSSWVGWYAPRPSMVPPESPPPPPSLPRRRTRGLVSDGKPGVAKKKARLLVAGVLVVGLGLWSLQHFVLAARLVHHSLPVPWPKNEPHGDPVLVGRELKAGDVFVTTLTSESRILLDVTDQIETKEGMTLDVQ